MGICCCPRFPSLTIGWLQICILTILITPTPFGDVWSISRIAFRSFAFFVKTAQLWWSMLKFIEADLWKQILKLNLFDIQISKTLCTAQKLLCYENWKRMKNANMFFQDTFKNIACFHKITLFFFATLLIALIRISQKHASESTHPTLLEMEVD